jgi:hypothetical protein
VGVLAMTGFKVRFCKNCRTAIQRSGVVAEWIQYLPTNAMHAYVLDQIREGRCYARLESICHAVEREEEERERGRGRGQHE